MTLPMELAWLARAALVAIVVICALTSIGQERLK